MLLTVKKCNTINNKKLTVEVIRKRLVSSTVFPVSNREIYYMAKARH